MASKGIDIKIGVDPDDAIAGAHDVESALDKVSKTLDDVGRGGTQDVKKLEKSISDLNRESMQSKDKLDRAFGKGFKSNLKEAEGGMTDLKSESMQTARETAASFDGTGQSIVDMFQEVSANAFQGFGAAGAAAGLAAAAGIGFVSSMIQSIQQDALATKGRISDIATELIATGGVGVRSSTVIREGMTKIITGGEGAVKALEDVKKASSAIGMEWQTVAQAYAGNEDAIDGVIKATKKQIKAVEDARTNNTKMTAEDEQGYIDRTQALNNYLDEFKKTQGEIDAAKAAEKAFLESGGAEMLAKEELISGLNTAYDDAAGSILDFVNKETGVTDTAGYIQAMKDKEKALLDYQASLAASGFTPEQKAALDKMGLDSASAFMNAYKNGTAAQKADLSAILTKTASDSSGAAKDVIDATFRMPTDAVVKTTVDQASVNAAKASIQSGISNGTYKITVKAYDKNGKVID
jgi:hypothetical protein